MKLNLLVLYGSVRSTRQGIKARDLALNSLLLEERTNEVLGEIDLNHSLYYGSEVVMKGITQFLESGKLSVTQ